MIACMASTTSQLLTEALELPRADRAELAARLLESLDDEEVSIDESVWAERLERRAAEIGNGTAELVSWDEMRERMRVELRADREARRR